MTIKGRKALQTDNEKLYEHNVAMSDELQKAHDKINNLKMQRSALLIDLENLLSLPFIKSVRKLISMRREYKEAQRKRDE